MMKSRTAAAVSFALLLAVAVSMAMPSDHGLVESKQLTGFWDFIFGRKESVLKLDAISLAATRQKYDFVLVSFMAPWCSVCQDMKDNYEAASQVLKDDVPPIILASVDCTANENLQLCTRHGVNPESYPTFIIFRKQKYPEGWTGPSEYRYMGIGPNRESQKAKNIIDNLRAQAAWNGQM